MRVTERGPSPGHAQQLVARGAIDFDGKLFRVRAGVCQFWICGARQVAAGVEYQVVEPKSIEAEQPLSLIHI